MKNRLKTVLLLGALTGILVGIGAALGGGFLHASVALAALLNLGAWFFSDRIVLALSHARELPPDEAPGLHAMVAELATRRVFPSRASTGRPTCSQTRSPPGAALRTRWWR
jgi:heat shock protein HtpX